MLQPERQQEELLAVEPLVAVRVAVLQVEVGYASHFRRPAILNVVRPRSKPQQHPAHHSNGVDELGIRRLQLTQHIHRIAPTNV